MLFARVMCIYVKYVIILTNWLKLKPSHIFFTNISDVYYIGIFILFYCVRCMRGHNIVAKLHYSYSKGHYTQGKLRIRI